MYEKKKTSTYSEMPLMLYQPVLQKKMIYYIPLYYGRLKKTSISVFGIVVDISLQKIQNKSKIKKKIKNYLYIYIYIFNLEFSFLLK